MTEKLGRKITLIAVAVVVAIVFLVVPSRPFRLGLDLQGGTRLVYRFDFEEAARRGQISKADLASKETLLDSFKEIIHQRLDPKGVKEISIRKQGSDQLVIELPGAAEFQAQTVKWKLGAELAAAERAQLVLDPGPAADAPASKEDRIKAVETIKAFPPTGGMLRIGTETIQYTVREGNVLRALQRGVDKTEVTSHAAAAQVELLTSNELETIITSIGDLQFMIVAQQNDPELSRLGTDLGKERTKLDGWTKANPGRSIEEFNLLDAAQGGPAGNLRWYPRRVERGQIETPAAERLEGVLVTSNPEWLFTGSDLKRVEPSQDQTGYPAVALEIADAKKSAFTEFTTTHIGRQMAIVLNREIATDPVIKSKLPGSCVIEGGAGGFTLKQVQDLVRILKSGSLRVKPTLLDRARVGASLGQDYINTSIISAFAALGLIVLFMLYFYRKLGIFSVIGLVLNLTFLLAGLAFLRATITLPGVAGIILTLGMAVDGNILIYERLREELARGLKLVQACKAAFERAAVAIIDANLTTLISGVILQYVGTGPIRGFAVTLNIGILSTLFTVIVVTEALVLLDIKRGTTKLTMAPMFAVPKIRFMANYKKFLFTSWAIASRAGSR
jgi:SecD/SecF fusion protein